MQVNEAVSKAKRWVTDVFEGEEVANVGLEEVLRHGEAWKITVSFSRPWNVVRDATSLVTGAPAVKRSYKVVTIADGDGALISITNRDD